MAVRPNGRLRVVGQTAPKEPVVEQDVDGIADAFERRLVSEGPAWVRWGR